MLNSQVYQKLYLYSIGKTLKEFQSLQSFLADAGQKGFHLSMKVMTGVSTGITIVHNYLKN